MEARFDPVTSIEDLEQVLAQSAEVPVLVFNHDPYRGISRRAYQEVRALPYRVALIDVARATTVTRYLSARTGVKHESPQVILLFEEAAQWSVSHYAITQQAIERARHDVETTVS